ncbi:MBL fold metallo-hydrolase [Frankia sp. Cppng1_Ct_nod]|uniref:MBL fold metallo-hydrolase n=1 Tax=Frankia sp. Cppng1_Ct_nod TaxID=2897162 RepID=UPI002024BA30|nr:MBL fold metallo-hydrolase [Frankia sp. Cppng1_Ct_nod]
MDVTWWGHSTVLIEDSGIRLLTDPVLGMRVAHLRRRAGMRPARDAAQVDAAVVSHLHADHLDIPSLRLLPPTAPLLVPRGAAALLRGRHPELAERCVEMVPGDRIRVPAGDSGIGGGAGGGAGGLDVLAVSARHDGSRGPWSRHRGPALGFVITGTRTAWFAGDTALYDAMADLAPLGIDLALVPVGGWGPNLGPGHLDPAGAVEAARRTLPTGTGPTRTASTGTGPTGREDPAPGQSAVAVPIHYGTFWPIGFDRVRPDRFHEPGREFARLADEANLAVRVQVLAHGQSLAVPDAGGPSSDDGRGTAIPTTAADQR